MSDRRSQSEKDAELRRAMLLLDIHGADLDRWPDDARAFAMRVESDPRFLAARRDAVLLEEALDHAEVVAAGEALKARILADAPTRANGAASPGFLFRSPARRLIPAGAFAALSAAGFVAGLTTAPAGAAAGDEALVYAEAAVAAAFADSSGWWSGGGAE